MRIGRARPGAQRFFEQEFGSERYSIDLAADAEDAARLAEANDYRAAILDLSIPEPGGLAMLRQVPSTRSQLPVLVLAGHTKAEERAQMLDLGADDLMPKPFAFSELAARVRALLRRGAHRADTAPGDSSGSDDRTHAQGVWLAGIVDAE